jgi:hypothetical protein
MGMDGLGHNGTMAGQSCKLELGGAWLEVVRGQLAGWLHYEGEGEGEVNRALAVPLWRTTGSGLGDHGGRGRGEDKSVLGSPPAQSVLALAEHGRCEPR